MPRGDPGARRARAPRACVGVDVAARAGRAAAASASGRPSPGRRGLGSSSSVARLGEGEAADRGCGAARSGGRRRRAPAPRSRASARMYVPDEQSTSTSRSSSSSPAAGGSQHVEPGHGHRPGASATSSPARTRVYERCPSTLIALHRARHLRDLAAQRREPGVDRASATAAGGAARSTSPSASSVTVDCPSRIVARVRLVGADHVREQPGGPLDAEHQHAGGHRVERAAVPDPPGARRAGAPAATTSCEVMPPGLSTTTNPSVGHSDSLRAATARSRPQRHGADRPAHAAEPQQQPDQPDRDEQEQAGPHPAQAEVEP